MSFMALPDVVPVCICANSRRDPQGIATVVADRFLEYTLVLGARITFGGTQGVSFSSRR